MERVEKVSFQRVWDLVLQMLQILSFPNLELTWKIIGTPTLTRPAIAPKTTDIQCTNPVLNNIAPKTTGIQCTPGNYLPGRTKLLSHFPK